jgi:hypothetical protein
VKELRPLEGLVRAVELEPVMKRRDRGLEPKAAARRTQGPELAAQLVLLPRVSYDDGRADSRNPELPMPARVPGRVRELTARPLGRPKEIARQKRRLRRPETRVGGAQLFGRASQ